MPFTHSLSAAEHPIKSVTVFKSSKAEVVRIFALDLASGENRIAISGLSSTIDPDSVRVSGLADGARLFDVVCRVRKPANPPENDPAEIIRVLEAKKRALINEKRVREHEADILVGYGKTLTGEHASPEQANAFLDTLVERGRRNLQEVLQLDEEIVEFTRSIAMEREQLTAHKGEANGEVVVVLSAPRECRVQLKLSYIVVGNATWEPNYDLHASTEAGQPSPSVTLQYRARITQSTGEDWKDTVLTLSTATSDTTAKGLPELKPLHVKPKTFGFKQANNANTNFGQSTGFGAFAMSQRQQANPQTQVFGAQSLFGSVPQPSTSVGLFGSAAPSTGSTTSFGGGGAATEPGFVPSLPAPPIREEAPETDGEGFEEVPAPGQITEATTVVSESALSKTYTVDGKSSVPSDGIAHQVLVAGLAFEANVTYVAVPRVETVAYLQCAVKNTSEYRLLPGPVNVFLDESFVSKTKINDINNGDTFTCTLGADPSIVLTYRRTSRTSPITGGAFAEQFKTVTYTTTTTLANKHRFALAPLIVRDSVPLSQEDKRVKVVLRVPAGLADAKTGEEVPVADGVQEVRARWAKSEKGKGGEREGMMEWVARVEGGKEVTLEMQYELKAPADANWFFKVED